MAKRSDNEPIVSIYGTLSSNSIDWGNFSLLAQKGVPITPGIVLEFKGISLLASSKSMNWFIENPIITKFLNDCNESGNISLLWKSSPVLPGIPRRYDCAYLDLNDSTTLNKMSLKQYIEAIKLFTEQVYGNLPQSFIESEVLCLQKQQVPRYWNLDTKELLFLAKQLLLDFEGEFNVPFPNLVQQIKFVIQKLIGEWISSPSEKQVLSILIKRQYRLATANLIGSGIIFPDRLAKLSNNYSDQFVINGDLDDLASGAVPTVAFSELPYLTGEIKRNYYTVKDWVNGLRSISQVSIIIDQNDGFIVDDLRRIDLPIESKLKLVDAGIKSGSNDFQHTLLAIRPEELSRILIPSLTIEQLRNMLFLGSGVPASPGLCSGLLCIDIQKIDGMLDMGVPIILAANSPGPEIVKSAQKASGLLFATGGATSHIAVIARGENKPCVSGVSMLSVNTEIGQLTIGENSVNEGSWLTIDGSSGKVFLGKIEKNKLVLPELRTINSVLNYCDKHANIQVYANADTAIEAENAFSIGAKGIGLCRIEHLLARPSSLESLQRVMLLSWLLKSQFEKLLVAKMEVANWPLSKGAKATLHELEQSMSNRDLYQLYMKELYVVEDVLFREFLDLINVSKGRTITIRLIDPPLAEFINEEIILQLYSKNVINNNQKGDLLRFIDRKDSMIGLRGIRLCNIAPEFTKSQIRSILLACKETKSSVQPNVDILVPFVIDAFEMATIRSLIAECMQELGMKMTYRLGAMIETPRSVMVIKDIARYSDFLSFGTNDLTQFTWAASRDYAEGDFLRHISYNPMGVDPFEILDQKGVGSMLTLAVIGARSVAPSINIGVCGEHASETKNLPFFEELGINYLSCTIPHIRSLRLSCGQRAICKLNLQDSMEGR